MASLSSPESRIKAAAQPGIKNQARCAGRNQESRITGGGQGRGGGETQTGKRQKSNTRAQLSGRESGKKLYAIYPDK